MQAIQEPTAIAVETILVATDFSLASDHALAYARALALRYDATVQLAHVYDPSLTTSLDAAELDIDPAERKRRSDGRLADIELVLTRVGIKTHTTSTPAHKPAEAILHLAHAQHADLIVAGTTSKTGFERLVLGSTAEQILRGADCPVLTVGPKARHPQPGPIAFKTIVFANDFSPEATKAAVHALSFAEDAGAKLYSCYAVENEYHYLDAREAVDAGFKKALEARIPASSYNWCSPECVVEHGAAAVAILNLAERVGADLIVLGARKASFWLTHIERGLTPALLAEATCPVLTVC